MHFFLKKKILLLKTAGIFFILLFALLYSHEEVGMSGNESGRFATVQAVAEQGVFHIENCNFRTVDRTVRNQHIYYDKLPALPFVVAGIYYPFHKLGGLNFVDNYHLSIYLINLIFGSVINILLFLWLFDLFRTVKRGSAELKFLLALSGVFGSWLLTYSTMLNNHTPAALAVLGVFIALIKYGKCPHPAAAALAGIAAGCSGLLELPCGMFFGLAAVAGVFLCAPAEQRRKHLGIVIACGGGMLLAGIALNIYAYGTLLPLYFGSHGVKGTFGFGSQPDHIGYFYHVLIGDRGLFFYTPFLLLMIPALPGFLRTAGRSEKVMLACCAMYMLFYMLGTNEFGGQSYGFRYFVAVIPVLWFWSGRFFLQLPHSVPVKAAVTVLVLWGVVTGLTGAYFPFNPGNEWTRTPPGHFTNYFSSFGGNLLCWSYENYPDSALTRDLIRRYGAPNSVLYMYWSFFHQKKINLLARLRDDFPEFYPGRKQ